MQEGLLPSFRFFMGPFEQLLSSEGGDLESFKAAVGSFFSKFVHTMKPAAACIHDIFRAIQFLGLETSSFLRAQCLVSRLEDEFPIVESAVFFHQGNVVWSQLQQEDTRLVKHLCIVHFDGDEFFYFFPPCLDSGPSASLTVWIKLSGCCTTTSSRAFFRPVVSLLRRLGTLEERARGVPSADTRAGSSPEGPRAT